eukprot:RCo048993
MAAPTPSDAESAAVDMSVIKEMSEQDLIGHVRDLKAEQLGQVSAENIRRAMAAVSPQQVATILRTIKNEKDIAKLVGELTEAQLKAAVDSITEATKRAATEALELEKEDNQRDLLRGLSEDKRKIITPAP